MPKGIRKAKGRSGAQGCGAEADFTVYQFANAEPSSVKSGRMSKADTTWSSQVKQMMEKPQGSGDSDLAWYEKDISEFDLLSDTEEFDEGGENEASGETAAPIVGRRRRRKLLSTSSDPDQGQHYPLDLWFLVGDCVWPEEVATFALICRSSHVVTHSARFWYRLYNRCYSGAAALPSTLRPECMERIHGLRDRVIRAIYIMYKPLQQRLQTRAPFEQDPDALKGACCTLTWYQNIKSHWHFYFKFSLPGRSDKHLCPLVRYRRSRTDSTKSLLADADIHHNPEYPSCVLQVVTQNFIPINPAIMGQVLANTSLSLSYGMRYHKLKLVFSAEQYNRGGVDCGTTFVLDPVLNAFVLHWWDPKYPHQPV